MNPETHPIGSAEAIPLMAALVTKRAASCNIRLLCIKGPFMAAQGIRPDRISQDIDVLLEPQAISSFVGLMHADGWRSYIAEETVTAFRKHAITLIHPFWPCTMDVHEFWPGFGGPTATTFRALWASRAELDMASPPIFTTGLIDSLLLCALNDIRTHGGARFYVNDGTSYSMQSNAELAFALEQLADRARDALPDEDLAQALDARAATLGCRYTAAPFLELIGAQVETPQPPGAQLQHWYDVVTGGGNSARAWMITLQREPWYGKPAVLFHALAVDPRQLRRIRPEAASGPLGYISAFALRLRSGWRHITQESRLLKLQKKSTHRRAQL